MIKSWALIKRLIKCKVSDTILLNIVVRSKEVDIKVDNGNRHFAENHVTLTVLLLKYLKLSRDR